MLARRNPPGGCVGVRGKGKQKGRGSRARRTRIDRRPTHMTTIDERTGGLGHQDPIPGGGVELKDIEREDVFGSWGRCVNAHTPSLGGADSDRRQIRKWPSPDRGPWSPFKVRPKAEQEKKRVLGSNVAALVFVDLSPPNSSSCVQAKLTSLPDTSRRGVTSSPLSAASCLAFTTDS